jgi:hypothetical protein
MTFEIKKKLNKLHSSHFLKSIGVSKTPAKSKQKGKDTEITRMQEKHYLEFEEYRMDLRIPYSPFDVEKNFKRVQEIIGIPDEISKCMFVSVKLKGKDAKYWNTANNACNALEFKFKRRFWKNKGRHMKTFIGAIEFDREDMVYHFHSLMIFKELKEVFYDDELEDIIISIIKGLKETNENNAVMVKSRIFPFCLETRELGETIEYLTKSSSKKHNPLIREIYSKKAQQRHKQLFK